MVSVVPRKHLVPTPFVDIDAVVAQALCLEVADFRP